MKETNTYPVQVTCGLDYADKVQWWVRIRKLQVKRIKFSDDHGITWEWSKSYSGNQSKPSKNLDYMIPDDAYTKIMMPMYRPSPVPPKKTPKRAAVRTRKLESGDNTMNFTIEERTFIGEDQASDISDDRVINQIGQAEEEITRLKSIKTDSKKIKKKIKQLRKFCKKTARYLDNR